MLEGYRKPLNRSRIKHGPESRINFHTSSEVGTGLTLTCRVSGLHYRNQETGTEFARISQDAMCCYPDFQCSSFGAGFSNPVSHTCDQGSAAAAKQREACRCRSSNSSDPQFFYTR